MQVTIHPQITSLEEFKVVDFFSDFTYVFRLVTSELEIRINNSKWSIPFQYIFSKDLKSIYSQGINGYLQSESVDAFYKMRILNQPLFELQTSPDFGDLVHLLFRLDANSKKEITASQFDKISVQDLLFEDDELRIDNLNDLDYEVRLYPNVTKNKEAFIANKKHWNIPYVSLSGFDFSDEMTEHFNITNQVCNINIVPRNYRCSFHKTIISENDLNNARFFGGSENHLLYKGKYEDCKNFFDNKKDLKKIASSELKSHIESPRVDDLNESDYFDAMTDGQLGSYDDYAERGGNIDDIETWSQG